MSPARPRHAAWLVAGALAVLAGVAWLTLGRAVPQKAIVHNDPSPQAAAARVGAAAPQGAGSAAKPAGTATAFPSPSGRILRDTAAAAATTSPPPAAAAVKPDAAQSLAQALQHGDERSPPVAHEERPAEAPTPAELADPSAYRRYENRRQEKLYRAYDQEAVIALGEMQRDLQRARAEQLPPELIAEGEEKAARLAETLRALRQGELDSDTPPAQ